MYTCSGGECSHCILKLEKNGISYKVSPAQDGKVNIFFGDCPCIRIIESFGKDRLNEFDVREDFILGILLGYDVTRQCERYLALSEPHECRVCSRTSAAV